jgi:hypothetical protein
MLFPGFVSGLANVPAAGMPMIVSGDMKFV